MTESQASLLAKRSSPDLLDWPTFRGHYLEIPASWRALCVAFLEVPAALSELDVPDTIDPVFQEWHSFRPYVVLCRQEADAASAFRAIQADAHPERAVIFPSGEFSAGLTERPVFGLLDLAYSSAVSKGSTSASELLVLLPLVRFPACPVDEHSTPVLIAEGRVLPPVCLMDGAL